MRVLICGLIGAAASAVAWFSLENTMQKEFGWLAVAVGLITGWSIHKAAGANAGVGYARGALAVILSLAAIVGGRQAYAKYMEATNENAAPAAGVAAVVPAAVDKDESDATADPPAAPAVPDPILTQPPEGGLAGKKIPLKQSISNLDMVWMCVAALAAYVIGKGQDPVSGEMDQQAEPAPQPEDDAGEKPA